MPMDSCVPAAVAPSTGFGRFRDLRNPSFVAALFGGLIACQALGYLILGTGRAGMGVSETILVLHNLLALACAWIGFRRSQGTAALFWFLFGICLVFLLVPAVLVAYSTVFNSAIVSSATWRVLYCLYGAPILMMLFLPEIDQRARLKSEIFLDLFQVAVVVGLCYSTFFYLPLQNMLPGDALAHNLNISNLQSACLLIAIFVRLQFARGRATRDPLLRLAIFVLVCGIVTFIGNWIDFHQYVTAAPWFDLGWALPYVAAGWVALTWIPTSESDVVSRSPGFFSFLSANLVLVTILFSIDVMADHWQQANGMVLTNLAVVTTLLAFSVRLALTQYNQQREIAQRKAAQEELFAATETISGLLDDARIEASAITQISELGGLLQACASLEEAFRAVPEGLRRLFPGTSGTLLILNGSKDQAEPVAKWGIRAALGLSFALTDCLSLREECPHFSTAQDPSPGCDHFQGDSQSVCIPLLANSETIGGLVIQDDEPRPNPAANSEDSARRFQLGSAVAKHIALAISNLNLREALRLQAIRDPLTGLYNRRYMQEFLERETHRARRRQSSLALMMFDLDNFKRYNDTYGHPAGDDALRLVADTVLRCIRAEDLACRYGGEEFVALFPECSLQQAAARAEEIRVRIQDRSADPASKLHSSVTVSIGIAAFPETTDQVALLFKLADDALYQAKREGRNRVVIARPAAAASAAASGVTARHR